MSGWVQTTLPIWSLQGISGRTGRTIFTFIAQALVPAPLSGSHMPEENLRLSKAWLLPVHVTDPQLISKNWLLNSNFYTTHTGSLLFPSLPKPAFVWYAPWPAATPCQVPSRCGEDVGVWWRWDGGQLGFSYSCGNQEQLLWDWWVYAGMNLKVPSVWLNLVFGVSWPRFDRPARAVPDVLEPALAGLVECLVALAFPNCFEC